MVVSSTIHDNIDKKLRDEIADQYAQLVKKEEIKMVHVSQRKIEAMEDSVLFAPYLYRLQKSIIVTEPADSLFGHEGRAKVRGSVSASQLDETSKSEQLKQGNPFETDYGSKINKTFNPGKRQTGMTKYLTRRLKGVPDEDQYLGVALSDKKNVSSRDPIKETMGESKIVKALRDTKWSK